MRKIWITVKKELRAIMRDKKSLAMMLVMPITIPIFMILFSFVYDTMFNDSTQMLSVGVNYELSAVEQQLTEGLLDVAVYDGEEALEAAFENEEILAYVVKEDNSYAIFYNPMDTMSAQCGTMVAEYLKQYNQVLTGQYLAAQNIDPIEAMNMIAISEEYLEGENEMANSILNIGIIYSVMAVSIVAVTCVTDVVAGEKERGTLETLLTFPLKARDIIAGKYVATTIACMATAVLSSLLVVVSVWTCCELFPMFEGMGRYINVSTVLITLVLMASFAVFVSGLCIACCSNAKSFKDAQSSLSPINFITIVPMILQFMKISVDAKLALVPIVSHAMLINEVITCGISADAIMGTVISVASTLVYSVALIFVIAKLYKSEKVLFAM